MVIFINQNTGKIEKMNMETVPLEITSDIVLYKKEESEDMNIVYDENGSQLYIDGRDGSITTEPCVFLIDNVIDEKDISKSSNDTMDDPIYKSITLFTKEYTRPCGMYKQIKLTEETMHLFSLEEILNEEFKNIVNASNFDSVIFGIFNNVDLSRSSFININNSIMATLNIDNKIIINIDLPKETNSIKLFNIDNIDIYVNNTKAINNTVNISNTNKLHIELINNTNNIVTIINPYILYDNI